MPYGALSEEEARTLAADIVLEADPEKLTVVRCEQVWAVRVRDADDPLSFCFFSRETWEFFRTHYATADEKERKQLVSIVREG